MARTFNEIMTELQAKDIYYSHERNGVTRGTFGREGSTTTTIACGGYRLLVQHYDGILISIMPRASSAGRGDYTLWSGAKRDSWNVDILGREYWHDHMGPCRLQEALLIAKIAWETCEGDVNKLYKAIGARGFCAMCGASLTDELSMARGIGPECAKKVYKGQVISKLQHKNLARV